VPPYTLTRFLSERCSRTCGPPTGQTRVAGQEMVINREHDGESGSPRTVSGLESIIPQSRRWRSTERRETCRTAATRPSLPRRSQTIYGTPESNQIGKAAHTLARLAWSHIDPDFLNSVPRAPETNVCVRPRGPLSADRRRLLPPAKQKNDSRNHISKQKKPAPSGASARTPRY